MVAFRTREPAFQLLTRLTPAQPQIDLPVLGSQWIVWLPPGYDLPSGSTSAPAASQGLGAWRRLFGPLAQSAKDRRLLGVDELISLVRASRTAADDVLRQMVEPLGVELSAGGASSTRDNWGWLLERVEPQFEALGRTLLLDWRALAEAGLTPEQPLADPREPSAWLRGLQRLKQADLMLLVNDQAVVITTAAAAAKYRRHLRPSSELVAAHVRDGALDEALVAAVRQRGSAHFQLPGQWVAEPALPWTARRAPLLDPADVHGWSAYNVDLATSSSAYIVRQAAVDVLGWGLFLLIVVLGWRSEGRPLLLIALTGMAMVAALLLPAIVAPLATCAVLALVLCLVIQSLRPRRTADRSSASAEAFMITDNLPTTAGMVLLALATSVNCSHAQEAAPQVHKVFIPTDDEDQFSGEHYWVPESLYMHLQRAAAETALAPRGWLLERAEYRAEGSWDVAQQRLIVPEIKCNFDLQVFEAGCQVVIPLARGEPLSPAEPRLLLDGREIAAEWSPQGDRLSFDVEDAGHYRLQLALRTSTVVEQGVSNIDLAVPPLAMSRLDLHLPRTAPAVEVPSARGGVEMLDEGQHLVAHLGGSPRLALRWRDGIAGRSLHPVVEADQLVWMHLQPGAVTAEVRLKYRVLEGSVRSVQWALDPRWQLQPGDESQPPATQVRGVAGAPQLLQFELPQPVSDQVTIAATLRLAGASGVGSYRIPYLEPLEVRSARHWLAVSVDRSLEYRETGADGLASLSQADFLSQWTDADAPPQKAYRLASSLPAWGITVRPTATHKLADSVLALSVARERAAVRFEATIETSGPTFSHRVVAPKELAIESIAIVEDDVDRLAHWSRDADGVLTLVLNEVAGGAQQLVIRGAMSLPRRGPWKLPVLRVDDADFRSAQVRIYRQPLQMVTVRSRSGLVDQPEQQRAIENQNPDLEKRFAGMGRIVSLLKAEGPAYSATLHFSPNQPKFNAAQTTTLRHDGNQWQAEVDCQLEVTSGIVDLLRFDIPSTWQGPFQVTPSATTTLADLTADGARQLIVRPYVPLTGQYHLKLSGPVAAPTASPLEAPAISLTGAQRLTQTLLLPTQLSLQPVSWETRGLVRIDAAKTTDGNVGLKGMEAFRAVDANYSAELRPAVRSVGEPRVLLADIALSSDEAGAVQGVASFDLDPAGSGQCILHVPAACRLLQASVNGTPAALGRQEDGAWRLGLGSDQLPQRIEVLFTSQLGADSSGHERWRLAAPHLGDLEVERSLWTVYGSHPWRLDDASAGLRTSSLKQEMTRLKSIASLMNLAPAIVPSDLADDLEAWYAPWARRYVAALATVRQELLRTGDSERARSIESEVRGIEQEQLQIARRLAMPESLLRGGPEPPAAEQARQIWQWTSLRQPAAIRLASTDAATDIVLEPTAPLAAQWTGRLLGSLAVVALSVLLGALVGSRWWQHVVAWRHAIGVALGVAWWLWLSPAALGWLIAAASLLAAYRQRRPPRREMGSSVIRLGASSHG
jgi:hypothetical protein